MKVKFIAVLFCLAIGLAVPAAAQTDLGAPDTLALVVSELEAGGQDSTFIVEMWAFNDGQGVAVQGGFKWDTEQIELITAIPSPLSSSTFTFVQTYDGSLAGSNTNNRAMFAGVSFSGATIPASNERKLLATYYFKVVNWDVNSSFTLDSAAWDDGSEMIFVDENSNTYIPVWGHQDGPILVKDKNAVQCDAPIIGNCPTSLDNIELCGPGEVCIPLDITGADNVVVTGIAGATWSNGQICFNADADISGNIHVVASVNCGEETICDFPVNVIVGAAPVIDCPTAAIDVDVCGFEEIGVPLAITGYDNVTTNVGSWANGMLLYMPTQSGPVNILVTATNNDGCGVAICTVTLNINVGDFPVITCPTTPIEQLLCAAGQVCVDLPIEGATTVDVPGATWVDGLLCFNAPTSDLYTFEVAATNDCGTVNCSIEVAVNIEGTPTITCPTAPVEIFLCDAGQVIFPLDAGNYDELTLSLGTFANGNISFNADTAGTYVVNVDATNSCGSESCSIIVEVAIGAAPVIACPDTTLKIMLEYPEMVCVPLMITGAATIDGGGATYENGQLCFQADTTGTYMYHVVATSDCGEATCDVSVMVDITPPCVTIMLSDTLAFFTAFEGDVTPAPESYTVTISSSMESVPFDFTITGVEAGLSVEPMSGTTPTDIVISGDVSGFPIGLSNSQLTISSVGERVCEPKMTVIAVAVEIFKQPSADTVIVADLPAVPGMQVIVPITYTNSCFLTGASINLSWTSTEIFLDSVSYMGSAIGEFDHNTTVDNDEQTVNIIDNAVTADPASPASGSLWANLHFTVSCDITPGTYPLSLESLQFTRNCGEGTEVDSPEFIAGGILVDSSENYLCGWVVTPNEFGGFDEVEAAVVEMWSSFPLGDMLLGTTSGHNGAFAFDDFEATRFDLYAYAEGFYPGTLAGVGFGEKGVMIVLQPLSDIIATDMWVDYYCESATILGQPLPNGSVVEVYDPQSVLCGRQVVTEPGVIRFMPVYRDSSMSAIDEGATTGDILSFRVNGEEALATGDVIYPAAYTQVEVCVAAGAKITKSCDLTEGWNLISWNINTESDMIEDVLGAHMDCFDVILGFEQGGLTYDPDLPQFSTLWHVDHLSGYWVKVKEGCQVTVDFEGLPVLISTPIGLNAGWNLVSYLADSPMPVEDALGSVLNKLMLAYGAADGIQIYQPGQVNFNTLTELANCQGYWLKTSADAELIYPSDGPVPAAPEVNPLIAEAARLAPPDVTPTTSWINLYSTQLTLDGEKVHAGAYIAAYSLDNRKIGGFTLTGEGTFGFMPVYADDAGNEGVTGLKPGDNFYLAIDGEETKEAFTWTQTGDRLEVTTLTAKGNSVGNLPDGYLLGQNYPNPFNPSTTITFSLPTASTAKIEIFNVLGKLVAVPFNGMGVAGENSVEWDGKLSDGQTTASGVYFYRLTSDSYTETRKMMLLK